jgi:hypothetical protein
VPEICDWSALKDREEQEDHTDRGGHRNSGVEDPGMDTINGNAQQGDDNRDFGEDTSNHVEDLAEPPALQAQLKLASLPNSIARPSTLESSKLASKDQGIMHIPTARVLDCPGTPQNRAISDPCHTWHP